MQELHEVPVDSREKFDRHKRDDPNEDLRYSRLSQKREEDHPREHRNFQCFSDKQKTHGSFYDDRASSDTRERSESRSEDLRHWLDPIRLSHNNDHNHFESRPKDTERYRESQESRYKDERYHQQVQRPENLKITKVPSNTVDLREELRRPQHLEVETKSSNPIPSVQGGKPLPFFEGSIKNPEVIKVLMISLIYLPRFQVCQSTFLSLFFNRLHHKKIKAFPPIMKVSIRSKTLF